MARRLGADHVVDASDGRRAQGRSAELTEGWGADYTIEAVGRPETLAAGLLAAAPGGTVSVGGGVPRAVSIPIPA